MLFGGSPGQGCLVHATWRLLKSSVELWARAEEQLPALLVEIPDVFNAVN